MKLLSLLLLLAAPALCQDVLEATLERPLWLKKAGELRFTAEAIEFQPKGADEPLRWEHRDIQLFDRVSRTELRILTYEDSKWKLGRDRELRFSVTSGEISDELFDRVRARLHRPTSDRVLRNIAEPAHRLAVKHLHPLGGCEGELLIFEDRIVYDSRDERHNRDWPLGEAVEGVWSSDAYELEVHVREPRVWRYQLKQRLDQELYERLKRQLYGLR